MGVRGWALGGGGTRGLEDGGGGSQGCGRFGTNVGECFPVCGGIAHQGAERITVGAGSAAAAGEGFQAGPVPVSQEAA
jgi:hypothetical protein